MKMSTEHYEKLKQMIEFWVLPKLKASLTDAEIARADLGKDPAMRFRWDLLWAIPYENRSMWFDEVYVYCNDDHIDTALRSIVNDIKKEEMYDNV